MNAVISQFNLQGRVLILGILKFCATDFRRKDSRYQGKGRHKGKTKSSNFMRYLSASMELSVTAAGY